MLDAGTFKALRDPTNVIELRGLWEGTVKFRSAGRFICPENDKVNFKGGVDGGVRRSTLAWPHPWTFTTASKLQPGEKLARNIKNVAYVKPIIPGLLLVLIEIDKVWGADWTSGQILPRPECVKQAVQELLMQRYDSNIEDFLEVHCELVKDFADASTPGQIMARMRQEDPELNNEKDLEGVLRRKLHFVSPQNRHRIKPSRKADVFIKLKLRGHQYVAIA